jgi:Uma2 family endonuclease
VNKSGKEKAMSAQPKYEITPEEYLQIERQAGYKSYYVDGVMYAMAGGTKEHNLIAGSIFAHLFLQLLNAPCEVYNSDMKVRASGKRKFHYPDVSVVCGQSKFADDEKDVLLNPNLIIEVLSETTAEYDRNEKFWDYQEIESFREYILVSQDEPLIERFVRKPDGSWVETRIAGIDQVLNLSSASCEISLRDIYTKVF